MITPPPVAPWWARAFHLAVTGPAAGVQLDRAAILLAVHGCRGLDHPDDVEHQLGRLDLLAGACRPATFEGWHRLLFVELGLGGNGAQYHDPRNSFLPDVLARRVGIPISLSVLAGEVGRRLGLAMWGVGMPGHFLLAHGPRLPQPDDEVPADTVFVDSFHGGEVLDIDGCARLFSTMYAPQAFHASFLAPTDAHHILIRMCNNLKSNYARARDLTGLVDIMRLRLCLPEASVDEGRELVRLLDAASAFDEASQSLDSLETAFPDDLVVLAQERDRLRARLN